MRKRRDLNPRRTILKPSLVFETSPINLSGTLPKLLTHVEGMIKIFDFFL